MLARRHEPEPVAPSRDPFLDNVKCVAIVLVVVGHALGLVIDSPVARTLYVWIYSFHMPAFVLICGCLSRRFTASPQQCRALIGHLLVPYLVSQVLYAVQADLVAGRPVRVGWVDPEYVLWFLVSLICWRLATPLLRVVRQPVLVAISVSLLAGLSDAVDGTLSLGRTAGLLPFFVAGLVVRPEHLQRLAAPAVRVGAVAAAFLALVAAAVLRDDVRREWLYWHTGYGLVGLDWPEGIALRVAALIAGAVLTAALLSLVPRRRCALTAPGRRTMYAFLLHGLVIKQLAALGVLDGATSLAAVIGVVAGGVALAAVLLSPAVTSMTGWLVESRWLRCSSSR